MDFNDRFGAFFRTEQIILAQVRFFNKNVELRKIRKHLQKRLLIFDVFCLELSK